MREYTEKMASIFHAFRIDNCHSTPLVVTAYLLDRARYVNPNLYVIAELFTNSEECDLRYVTQAGLNSLIREAMRASDSFELSRQIYRYGGIPAGSMSIPPQLDSTEGIMMHRTVELKSTGIHGLLMDFTHDNETPFVSRTFQDIISTGCLVPWSLCATGSAKGYDELFLERPHLAADPRRYPPPMLTVENGIAAIKSVMLALKKFLLRHHFCEIHVQHEKDFIIVHRRRPDTQEGYLIIVRTSFSNYGDLISG
jgi:glycogen debranching enzyme